MDRPKKDVAVFILAGGKSSRMGMCTPKVLMPVGGRPMIFSVLEAAQSYGGKDIYIVVSPQVKTHLEGEKVHLVVQEETLGTGHAFGLALEAAAGNDPDIALKKIVVLLGDTPLITSADMANLLKGSAHTDVLVVGMCPPCPDGYGRLYLKDGCLTGIVESKDATEVEKQINLCNTGVMCLDGNFALNAISRLVPSAITGEWYLTDLVQYAERSGYIVGAWENFRGINTRQELVQAEAAMQQRFRQRALDDGAYLMSPETTFLSYDTQCAENVVIYPMVCCGPGVILDEGVTIYSGSMLERCHIKKSSRVGPFARIRAGTVLGPFGEIGNFVETKNATIGHFSQVKHLSYIGDAVLGDHVNIGAGVITCNYDGHVKNMTQLDDGVFVGSHTAFIAPVHVGKNSTIGAGSVVTKSVDSHTLALSRAEMRTIPLRANSKHLTRCKKGISQTYEQEKTQ